MLKQSLNHRIIITACITLFALFSAVFSSATAYAEQPSSSDTVDRIYFLPFWQSEAIILESDGHFGMVDAGEDGDYPNGSDPRYPFREGTTTGPNQNVEDYVVNYMKNLGINKDNFDFFIGTHPHSDHIACADTIIETFEPQRVYTPEYSDAYVYNPSRLWDNQYVYDHLIDAAKKVGTELYTDLDPNGPFADKASFTLGSMTIQILNTDSSYKQKPVFDANEFCWGVLVQTQGYKTFLAADIIKTGGDEATLASQLGDIDVLLLGHHGLTDANSIDYLTALAPEVCIHTLSLGELAPTTLEYLKNNGVRYYSTTQQNSVDATAIILDFTPDGLQVNTATSDFVIKLGSNIPNTSAAQIGAFFNDVPINITGWCEHDGLYYYFANSPVVATYRWIFEDGHAYYLGPAGVRQTRW